MATTSENLPKTGYSKETPNFYLLNAGAWVKNLKWDKATSKWSFDLIGATSGGSKITIKNTYRQVEVDGVFTTPVGSDMIEEAEATAELNFIEMTLENLKMILLADSSESGSGGDFPPGYTIIKPKAKISTTDYVENMAYVGTLAGSNKPIIIIFHYAICTSGLEVEPKDKEEAIYSVTFEARTGADNLDTMALPVTILYPKMDVAPAKAPMLAEKQIDGAPEASKVKDEDKGATK